MVLRRVTTIAPNLIAVQVEHLADPKLCVARHPNVNISGNARKRCLHSIPSPSFIQTDKQYRYMYRYTNHKMWNFSVRTCLSNRFDAERCWRCGVDRVQIADPASWNQSKLFFCEKAYCPTLHPSASINYFALFGFVEEYDIDTKALTSRFRKIQQRMHPDATINLNEEQRKLAAAQSSLVNRAYDTLLKPISRAIYLLELNKETLSQSGNSLDSDFLMKVMELNEQINDTKDPTSLKLIFDTNKKEIDILVKNIELAFRTRDISRAKDLIAKVKYLVNIEDQIKAKTFLH